MKKSEKKKHLKKLKDQKPQKVNPKSKRLIKDLLGGREGSSI